jgi:hypothetical protein
MHISAAAPDVPVVIHLKDYMNALFIVLIFFLQTSIDKETIVGKYQVCSFSCETIQIFPDSTFDYRFYGDLSQRESCFGKITNFGENLYLANSYEQPFPLFEKYDSLATRIKVLVTDENSNPLESANVYAITLNDTLKAITDRNGFVQFPKNIIKKIWVNYVATPTVIYSPKYLDSNFFKVKQKIDSKLIYVTNEIWKIENNTLYFVNRDIEYSLKKVK